MFTKSLNDLIQWGECSRNMGDRKCLKLTNQEIAIGILFKKVRITPIKS